jgi:NADH dehydrogenase
VATITELLEEEVAGLPQPLLAREVPQGKTRILILGAGFGGLTAALELEKGLRHDRSVEVVLVDRNPYHLFTPMLYEVAAGEVEPGHIAYPLRWLMRRKRIDFYQGEIHRVDLSNRRVEMNRTLLHYHYLVLALGSVTNFFHVRKAEQLAYPLKTLGQAISIKGRIVDSFRQAELEDDEAERRRLLSFAVVGGGATGIEMVASLSQLMYSVLSKDYPRIYPGEISLRLVEASGSLLAGMDKGLAGMALKKLQPMGVNVHLDTRVVGIEEDGIHTAQGETLPARSVIWATGVLPNPLLDPLPIIKAKDYRARVRRTLRLPMWPGVYAVGDNTLFMDQKSEAPLPAKAAVASQEGKTVASNIIRALRHQRQVEFRYKYEGDLVALGRSAALAKVMGRCFDGLPAFVLWRLVHLWKLPGMQNQMSVALDWVSDMLFRTAIIRPE